MSSENPDHWRPYGLIKCEEELNFRIQENMIAKNLESKRIKCLIFKKKSIPQVFFGEIHFLDFWPGTQKLASFTRFCKNRSVVKLQKQMEFLVDREISEFTRVLEACDKCKTLFDTYGGKTCSDLKYLEEEDSWQYTIKVLAKVDKEDSAKRQDSAEKQDSAKKGDSADMPDSSNKEDLLDTGSF